MSIVVFTVTAKSQQSRDNHLRAATAPRRANGLAKSFQTHLKISPVNFLNRHAVANRAITVG